MASFNKVILLGNLTRDPELRTANNGNMICRLGVAMSRVTKNSDGESREEVVFVDVDAFGKQAETIGRYFVKGRPIFIEGRLRLDQWESNTGEKRSKLCVVLENFQFVNSGRFDDEETTGGHTSGPVPFSSTPLPLKRKENSPLITQDGGDEDVPF
ncbi:MAG: single-stranded DNA-binding protein [Puniceicoccales bacterium]|jgi:single-strand DNA-binding protein|nr:single-stranded DNA-binding protein [Puniceicoccales bacterium]